MSQLICSLSPQLSFVPCVPRASIYTVHIKKVATLGEALTRRPARRVLWHVKGWLWPLRWRRRHDKVRYLMPTARIPLANGATALEARDYRGRGALSCQWAWVRKVDGRGAEDPGYLVKQLFGWDINFVRTRGDTTLSVLTLCTPSPITSYLYTHTINNTQIDNVTGDILQPRILSEAVLSQSKPVKHWLLEAPLRARFLQGIRSPLTVLFNWP